MRRSIGFFAVCLMLLGINLAVSAEEIVYFRSGDVAGVGESAISVTLMSGDAGETALEDRVYEALKNRAESLVVSGENVKEQQAKNAFYSTVYKHPELFYVNTAWGYSKISEDAVYVEEFLFWGTYASYAESPEVLEEKQAQIDAEVARITASIASEMSDAEKALAVHDWFALHYRYNTPASLVNVPTEAHRIDGLFIDKTAVCQGYALGYVYVLNKLGLETIYVPSASMNHAWNMVKIDEKWYHVDVTWDDPSIGEAGDIAGLVMHTNFLRSDEGIEGTGHTGWTAPHTASADYEGFWKLGEDGYVYGGMFYNDGKWYYMSYGDLVSFDPDTEEMPSTIKADVEREWDTESGILPGVNLAIYHNRIFYNSHKAIYCIELDGTNERVFLTPEKGEAWVFGLMIDGDIFHYGLTQNPNVSVQRAQAFCMNGFIVEIMENSLKITENEAHGAGRFFVGFYQGNELVGLEAIDFKEETESALVPIAKKKADAARIYVWNDITPLTKAKSFPVIY